VEPSDFAKLIPGRIFLAGVTDMRGLGWKERPVVVLSSPTANHPDHLFAVACGSSKGPDAGNENFAILGQRPHGHPRTGLFAKTWFYAGWIETVTVGDVVRFLTRFPEHDFQRLLEIIAFLRSSQP
jgi:hypothetical protein